MTAEEKIEYVKNQIDEETFISPKGPIWYFLYSVGHPDNEEWTVLTRSEQRRIIKKLEEDGYIKNVKESEDGEGFWLEKIPQKKGKESASLIIRAQTLELIARHLGDLGSGSQIVDWLENWGVPSSLIEYPNTKWRMVYSVLNHYASSSDKKDQKMLFEIIGEMLHPLLYNGDKQVAEKAAEEFNKYLEYDGLMVLYSDFDKKYSVSEIKNLIEVSEEDVWQYENTTEEEFDKENVLDKEKEELEFLRKPENREQVSALRKAYQLFISIVEIHCQNPSKPNIELNDDYINTKSFINKIVSDLTFEANNGYKLTYGLLKIFIPFKNLFEAEMVYEDNTTKSLKWDNIRPKMHASYGYIDEVYRKAEGSDVLSESNIQEELNDVSLRLSKLKAKNEKAILEKSKQASPQTTIQEIAITSMPPLKLDNEMKENIQKVSLKSLKKAVFDEETGIIKIGNRECQMPYDGTQYSLCKIMFRHKANEPVSWDVVYEEIKGEEANHKNKADYSVVNNAKNLANEKIKEVIITDDDLFVWENKSIKRVV